MPRHAYLFSYAYPTGSGHLDFSLPAPLQASDLPSILQVLQQRTGYQVVITNIYKFEDPAPLPVADALPDAPQESPWARP